MEEVENRFYTMVREGSQLESKEIEMIMEALDKLRGYHMNRGFNPKRLIQ